MERISFTMAHSRLLHTPNNDPVFIVRGSDEETTHSLYLQAITVGNTTCSFGSTSLLTCKCS